MAPQYAENVEGPIKVTLYFFCISEIHNSFFSVICVLNSRYKLSLGTYTHAKSVLIGLLIYFSLTSLALYP